MNLVPTPTEIVVEFDAASWAVQNRPNTYAGIVRKGGQQLADWLTNVSWWRAYPSVAGQKIAPGDAIAVQVWLRMRTIVQELLAQAEPKGDPEAGPMPWTKSAPLWPLSTLPRTKYNTGSRFAVKRPWNGTTTRHHCGVDIGAPLHATVLAPEAGVVLGEVGWEQTVKAIVLQLDSGLTILLGGIVTKSSLAAGTRVKQCDPLGTCTPVAKIGAYPKGSTMLHAQLYDRVLTVGQVNARKSWKWQTEPPVGLIDPEPYLITGARRTQIGAPAMPAGFYGLTVEEEEVVVDETAEKDEGVELDQGAVVKGEKEEPPAAGGDGAWVWALGLFGLGLAVTRGRR